MDKRLAISILVFFISVAAFGTEKARRNLLRDGFVLTGVDGKLTKGFPIDDFQLPTENQKSKIKNRKLSRWFFEFDSDVSDDKGQVFAGERVGLLPSAVLEKMTADVEKRSDSSYRLWGRVTRYRNGNFIFPIYFLPLSKVKQPALPAKTHLVNSKSHPEQEEKPDTIMNEPNDVLAIPDEIIAKLATRRTTPALGSRKAGSLSRDRPEQLLKELELKTDFILADRTALLVRQADGGFVFVFDALGRNVPQVSFKVLPCEILELAEFTQSAEPEPLRFKIAGIVTKYKGQNYLLLQRSTRVYSHENFGR